MCIVSSMSQYINDAVMRACLHRIFVLSSSVDTTLPFTACGWNKSLWETSGANLEFHSHGEGHSLGSVCLSSLACMALCRVIVSLQLTDPFHPLSHKTKTKKTGVCVTFLRKAATNCECNFSVLSQNAGHCCHRGSKISSSGMDDTCFATMLWYIISHLSLSKVVLSLCG